MWRAQAHDEESRLEAKKELKYKETTRVRLKWLHFRWNESEKLDDTNVKRLKSIFRKECRWLDIHNHICAVVDQQHLNAAILISEISVKALLTKSKSEYSKLVFSIDYQLKCLHEQHRIQAGKKVLSSANKWWTVNLYLADMMKLFSKSTLLISIFYRHRSRAENISDREVFQRRKARQRRDLLQDTSVSLSTQS